MLNERQQSQLASANLPPKGGHSSFPQPEISGLETLIAAVRSAQHIIKELNRATQTDNPEEEDLLRGFPTAILNLVQHHLLKALAEPDPDPDKIKTWFTLLVRSRRLDLLERKTPLPAPPPRKMTEEERMEMTWDMFALPESERIKRRAQWRKFQASSPEEQQKIVEDLENEPARQPFPDSPAIQPLTPSAPSGETPLNQFPAHEPNCPTVGRCAPRAPLVTAPFPPSGICPAHQTLPDHPEFASPASDSLAHPMDHSPSGVPTGQNEISPAFQRREPESRQLQSQRDGCPSLPLAHQMGEGPGFTPPNPAFAHFADEPPIASGSLSRRTGEGRGEGPALVHAEGSAPVDRKDPTPIRQKRQSEPKNKQKSAKSTAESANSSPKSTFGEENKPPEEESPPLTPDASSGLTAEELERQRRLQKYYRRFNIR